MNKFTVLLSVYHKEDPAHLGQSIESISISQTMKPDQIVLVKDGPLTEDLDNVVKAWQDKLRDALTVVALEKNVGLASALNLGLKHCKYDLVARMDTDDISEPDRFEKQVGFMSDHPDVDVCSGQIKEWSQDFSRVVSERKLPISHVEIVKFAKKRSPISHPAVMFRKSAVLEVGAYPVIYPEDYPLWGAMLANGSKFANLTDTILNMRVGNALTERRGLSFLKGEVKVFKYLHEVGFLTTYETYRNILQRGVVRLAPVWLKKLFYRYLR